MSSTKLIQRIAQRRVRESSRKAIRNLGLSPGTRISGTIRLSSKIKNHENPFTAEAIKANYEIMKKIPPDQSYW